MKHFESCAILVAAAAAACSSGDPMLSDQLEVVGPRVVADHLVWVNQTGGSVVWVDPTGAAPTRALHLSQDVRSVAFGRTSALVLGDDGGRSVLDAVAIPSGDRSRVDLFGAFERAVVSGSGRWAILLHDARTAADSPIAAQNHNEIAVVDLAAGVARRVVLDTESTSPRNVVFSPREERAAVVLDAAVVVVGLDDEKERLVVPLELARGERLVPEQAIFAPAAAYLFLRTTGTSDVVALAITAVDGVLSGSLNFLAVPGAERLLDIAVPPADRYDGHVVALFRRAGGTGSVAARIAADGDVSDVALVSLDGPATGLAVLEDETVLLHGSPAYVGGVGNAYVAGWDPIDGRVDEDTLAGPAMGPLAVGRDAAFVLHSAEGGSAVALSALTIRRNDARLGVALRPLVLGGKVKDYVCSQEDGRVVLAVDVRRDGSGAAPSIEYGGGFAGDTGALAIIDPADLAITTVALDAPIVEVGVIRDHYYAVHASPLGDVTVVPRAAPDRAGARRFDGVLLTGLLDRDEVIR